MVVVNSGEATLAAAHKVTGAQVAAFLEDVARQNGAGGTVGTWRDQPTDLVDVCIFDGDFYTMTPGPPGHDNTAVRVLVTVAGGQAQLWAIARKDGSAIPTSDPAASSQ